MPRIPEKNPRYRNKNALCDDVAFVLSAPLQWGTQFAVLADVVWVWSEFNGKYKGCRYWSRSALQHTAEIKILVHEHVVPKTTIISLLADLKDPTASAVRHILETYCIGVVLTREEDRKLNAAGLRSAMPTEWSDGDVWARYRLVGIECVDTHAT